MTTVTTPSTRQELVSWSQSEDRTQTCWVRSTLQELLEFELNNWEPIPTCRYSFEKKEPSADGPKLLDLFRKTFTWDERISLMTTITVEGDTDVAVKCKDREHFQEMMSEKDLYMNIEFGDPIDPPDDENTYVDPLDIELCVAYTRSYAPDVFVTNIQVKETDKEEGCEVLRNHLLKMHKEDLDKMSHLTEEDILTVVKGIPFLTLKEKS